MHCFTTAWPEASAYRKLSGDLQMYLPVKQDWQDELGGAAMATPVKGAWSSFQLSDIIFLGK